MTQSQSQIIFKLRKEQERTLDRCIPSMYKDIGTYKPVKTNRVGETQEREAEESAASTCTTTFSKEASGESGDSGGSGDSDAGAEPNAKQTEACPASNPDDNSRAAAESSQRIDASSVGTSSKGSRSNQPSIAADQPEHRPKLGMARLFTFPFMYNENGEPTPLENRVSVWKILRNLHNKVASPLCDKFGLRYHYLLEQHPQERKAGVTRREVRPVFTVESPSKMSRVHVWNNMTSSRFVATVRLRIRESPNRGDPQTDFISCGTRMAVLLHELTHLRHMDHGIKFAFLLRDLYQTATEMELFNPDEMRNELPSAWPWENAIFASGGKLTDDELADVFQVKHEETKTKKQVLTPKRPASSGPGTSTRGRDQALPTIQGSSDRQPSAPPCAGRGSARSRSPIEEVSSGCIGSVPPKQDHQRDPGRLQRLLDGGPSPDIPEVTLTSRFSCQCNSAQHLGMCTPRSDVARTGGYGAAETTATSSPDSNQENTSWTAEVTEDALNSSSLSIPPSGLAVQKAEDDEPYDRKEPKNANAPRGPGHKQTESGKKERQRSSTPMRRRRAARNGASSSQPSRSCTTERPPWVSPAAPKPPIPKELHRTRPGLTTPEFGGNFLCRAKSDSEMPLLPKSPRLVPPCGTRLLPPPAYINRGTISEPPPQGLRAKRRNARQVSAEDVSTEDDAVGPGRGSLLLWKRRQRSTPPYEFTDSRQGDNADPLNGSQSSPQLGRASASPRKNGLRRTKRSMRKLVVPEWK